ncbi:MAG: 2-C-methyl-D-erythritol 4-phosphate cytidylyltransferase [Paramuribaculum sp.]|nr:2-C-methyl-D-erythritol 4-phosphate cytidylyltransferase [Paramuribaculum sp.]
MSDTINVVIVAAGNGTRFGSDLPKQFQILGGRPLLMTTIDRLRRCMPSARYLLVLGLDFEAYWRNLCIEYGFDSPEVVIGGATRWESVRNALRFVEPTGIVLIHDGARPFVSGEVVGRLIESISSGHQGALPVLPLVDSIREVSVDGSCAVDRSRYVAVQTPQAFDAAHLLKAYTLPYNDRFTDDASVMEAMGFCDFQLIAGDADTFKITMPRDMILAQAICERTDNAAT